MSLRDKANVLRADHDQDMARAMTWWRAATLKDKLAMVDTIAKHYDDPHIELMSRFAQLGFDRVAMLAAEEES